ncbi:DUF721 domain-containing protein [Oceanibium sediminis]|uniref:DUF721 domain-containing protein n=1 Tax=Oceanibium sediminis TaxID=2026339 RepID=UPI001E4377F1|nr:DciA family protein [Oceanibium sediminis]
MMAKKQGADQSKSQIRRVNRFTQAGALVGTRVKGATAKRGFAETRLLTHWSEICGPELAAVARPVKMSYTRAAMGATLTIACEGARAPEVQMQAETIRARVNACYGYNAVTRVRLAQEDSEGFAEGQRIFQGKATAPAAPPPDPALQQKAAETAAVVENADLRLALEALGRNILTKRSRQRGQS